MSPQLTKKDRQFLQSVGIRPEPFNDERLALAERIAKHSPPTAQADPEVARHELIRLAARGIANLPRRGQLDLLTRLTVERLLKEFGASAKNA